MKKAFRIAIMTIGALLITTGNSWASTVYDKLDLFKTETFYIEQFEITEAGTYIATLTDFEFPAPMVDTGMSVITTTERLGSVLEPGSFQFNATPGNYFVSFFGSADPSTFSKLGLYGIEISQIPVPPAVWLFCSGLLGLISISRRKKAV